MKTAANSAGVAAAVPAALPVKKTSGTDAATPSLSVSPCLRGKYRNDKTERTRRVKIGHHIARAMADVFPPILTLAELGELFGHLSPEAIRLIQDEALYKVGMKFREEFR